MRTFFSLLAAAGLLAAGCNGILGIDEAKQEPDATGTGGAAGSDGTGGAAGNAGASAEGGSAGTGATGGSAGAAGTAGAAGAGGAPATPCAAYCTAIMTNCQGLDQEYIDYPTCLSLCSHYDPGAPGDQMGNSLACRTYHAGAAAADPVTHCHHAGPLGAGVCGEPCEGFCLLDIGVCGQQSMPPYDGEVKCKLACKAFNYEPSKGDIALKGGDTLNCRNYHLQAAVGDQTTHCPHTGVVSAPCSAPLAQRAGHGAVGAHGVTFVARRSSSRASTSDTSA